MIKTDREEQPDRENSHDDPLLTVVGIAAIIYVRESAETHSVMDIEVFAGKMNAEDPDTNKKCGDTSLVQEKIQGRLTPQGTIIYEAPQATLQRALGEVICDEDLQQNAGTNFQRVIFDREELVPLPSLSIPNAAGRVLFVSHAGDHSRYTPFDQQETTSTKPVPIRTLLADERLRDTSRTILEHVLTHGLLTRAITLDQQGLTEPIYPPGYSFTNSTQGTDVTKLLKRRDRALEYMGR